MCPRPWVAGVLELGAGPFNLRPEHALFTCEEPGTYTGLCGGLACPVSLLYPLAPPSHH